MYGSTAPSATACVDLAKVSLVFLTHVGGEKRRCKQICECHPVVAYCAMLKTCTIPDLLAAATSLVYIRRLLRLNPVTMVLTYIIIHVQVAPCSPRSYVKNCDVDFSWSLQAQSLMQTWQK